MKTTNKIAGLICFTLLCALITACGRKADTAPGTANSYAASNSYSSSADMALGESAYSEEKGELMETAQSQTATAPIPDDGRKRIRRVSLDVQTKEFDSLTSSLMQAIRDAGGYLETSEIRNNGYYDGGNRYAYMVARVPKDQADAFIAVVGESALITNKQESVEDVTLAYTDTESRIKALEVEQERLMALLEKADSLDSIIALESRLTEVRYELENYTSQLRTYDNQVEYSFITMNIQEVERLVEVQQKPTIWTRMRTGLSESLHSIARGAENFAVWLVANLPFLLIWAAVIAAAGLLIRRFVRRHRGRKKDAAVPPTGPEKKE